MRTPCSSATGATSAIKWRKIIPNFLLAVDRPWRAVHKSDWRLGSRCVPCLHRSCVRWPRRACSLAPNSRRHWPCAHRLCRNARLAQGAQMVFVIFNFCVPIFPNQYDCILIVQVAITKTEDPQSGIGETSFRLAVVRRSGPRYRCPQHNPVDSHLFQEGQIVVPYLAEMETASFIPGSIDLSDMPSTPSQCNIHLSTPTPPDRYAAPCTPPRSGDAGTGRSWRSERY